MREGTARITIDPIDPEEDDQPRMVTCTTCCGAGYEWESPFEYGCIRVTCRACQGAGGHWRYGRIVRGQD